MNIEYYDRRKEEWSTSETEQIHIEYLYKQLTILQIAYVHKRTPGDILYKLKILHIISEYKYARGYFDYINSNLYTQIMEKMHNEKKKRLEQNVGQPWTSEEDSQLISEYNSNINITEICKIHKRNIGGIRSRFKRLNCKKESNHLQDFNELKQDIKELKETVKELTGMLNAIYEFETA